MLEKDLASQFSVFILTSKIDTGASLKVQLGQSGFESFLISDAKLAGQSLRESLPHVVILFTDFIKGSLAEALEMIQEVSAEIQILLVGEEKDFHLLSRYFDFGVQELIPSGSPGFDKLILNSVQNTCEKLYLTFQNESLLEDLKILKSETEQHREAEEKIRHELASFRGLEKLIQAYRTAESKEQLLSLFMDQLTGHMVLYFKYLPSIKSFVVIQGRGIPAASIEGVGCQITDLEAQDLQSQVALGVLPGTLSLLMKNAFDIGEAKLLPLFTERNLEGVFVIPQSKEDRLKAEIQSKVSEQFSLFNLAYSHFSLEKHIEVVDLRDPVTEVFNSKYYNKKLQDEVQRARRLKRPISVVKVAIDDFEEIEQTLGLQVRDRVLMTISNLMVKSIRAHDFVARLQNNELAMVLVHCSKKGAGLRADRLRRFVETSSVLDHGIKLSISVGISEYPGLCESAAELDRTASQALQHIFDKGGNRICLFKAPQDFSPEFEVKETSGEL